MRVFLLTVRVIMSTIQEQNGNGMGHMSHSERLGEQNAFIV